MRSNECFSATSAISREDVRLVLENGEIVESYPNDTPYPSRLILGWSGKQPIHIVVAENAEDGEKLSSQYTNQIWLAGSRIINGENHEMPDL